MNLSRETRNLITTGLTVLIFVATVTALAVVALAAIITDDTAVRVGAAVGAVPVGYMTYLTGWLACSHLREHWENRP